MCAAIEKHPEYLRDITFNTTQCKLIAGGIMQEGIFISGHKIMSLME